MTDVVLRVVGEDTGTDDVLKKIAASLDRIDQNTKKVEKSTEQHEKKVNSLNKSLDSLQSGLGKALVQYEGFKNILADVGRAFEKTTGAYLAQADAVRELSQFTGATITETSRLMEVFDDAGVSVETLRTGMRYLADQGVTPSIESIALLSDEYATLTRETDRVNFLTEKFGARGAELGKIFDQTGAQIRESAKDIGNALTEADIKNAEELRRAWDSINDTFAAINNSIQRELVPGWAALLGGTQLLIDAITDLGSKAGKTDDEIRALANAEKQETIAASHAAIVAQNQAKVLDGLGKVTDGATNTTDEYVHAMQAASDAMSVYNDDALKAARRAKLLADAEKERATQVKLLEAALSGNLQKAHDDYISTLSTLTDEHDELIAKKEKLLSQGYSPEGDAVAEVNKALDENATAQDEAAAAADRVTKALLYQQVSGALDPQAALELARAWGLVSETDYNVAKAIEAVTAAYDKNADGVITASEAAGGFQTAMDNLKNAMADGVLTADELKGILENMPTEKNVQINVNTTYTETYAGSGGGSGSGGGGGGGGAVGGGQPPIEMQASGGHQYPGQPYLVGDGPNGEIGPWTEMVVPSTAGTTLSAAQTRAALSGGSSFNFGPGSVIINVGSGNVDEIARKILPSLQKLVERNRNAGTGR